MTNINRVCISGNLTRDAEFRMAGQTPVLSFSVAVNDRRKAGGEWKDFANYIDCALFGARAEAVGEMMRKGAKVCVEGKLRWSSWEAQDGSRRSKVEVAVEELELMSKADWKSGGGVYDEEVPF